MFLSPVVPQEKGQVLSKVKHESKDRPFHLTAGNALWPSLITAHGGVSPWEE